MIRIVTRLLFIIMTLPFWINFAVADCVYDAKSSTSFQILDPNTIMLMGHHGGIIIKTFSFLYAPNDVQVLKDDFCDFEDTVMYIDGELIDAQAVKSLR